MLAGGEGRCARSDRREIWLSRMDEGSRNDATGIQLVRKFLFSFELRGEFHAGGLFGEGEVMGGERCLFWIGFAGLAGFAGWGAGARGFLSGVSYPTYPLNPTNPVQNNGRSAANRAVIVMDRRGRHGSAFGIHRLVESSSWRARVWSALGLPPGFGAVNSYEFGERGAGVFADVLRLSPRRLKAELRARGRWQGGDQMNGAVKNW